MRRLHAVGKHEKFVASGVYEFEQNSVKIGLTESWSIHEVGGAQFIRADLDGRTHDGRSILFEALRSPDGQIERVDLRAYGNAQDAVKSVRASYTFFDNRAETIRIVNNNIRIEEVMVMPTGSVIYAGLRVLYGFTIPYSNLPEVRAFYPQYSFADPQHAFKWRDMAFTGYQFEGEEQIEVSGKSYSARLYQAANGTGRAWLDPFGILLCEESASQTITLKQYAHRPEPHLYG